MNCPICGKHIDEDENVMYQIDNLKEYLCVQCGQWNALFPDGCVHRWISDAPPPQYWDGAKGWYIEGRN